MIESENSDSSASYHSYLRRGGRERGGEERGREKRERKRRERDAMCRHAHVILVGTGC